MHIQKRLREKDKMTKPDDATRDRLLADLELLREEAMKGFENITDFRTRRNLNQAYENIKGYITKEDGR